MDVKRIRRRAFWIGLRSVVDLSGRRTVRDIRQLAADSEPPPLKWAFAPPVIKGNVFTSTAPPNTHVTWG